ncbi:MAG: hydroxymethylbilane synthase [Fusobacterium sp. JB021]|nr:hydroxymethylbilane synthase [Fusobacterium sp. JB020]MDP0494373.1 hydroxymethylbilane synthase [Fusobacterium sp. JB021]MDP0506725.1 hydroxymethylbilane synthase [Fusobacterium sp. JB019]
MKKLFKIGTRGSILALAQTKIVKELIKEKFPELELEIKEIITTGDKDLRTNWGDKNISLKNFFTKEIEKELLEGEIDFAVHSMKDMPIINPKGLILGGVPKRADNRDVFISKTGKTLKELPENPIIGTSSIRRATCVKELREDAVIKPIRGNIHTRLRKLKEEDYDGIILAGAGLIRTGLEEKITEYFNIDEIVPAPAQGAIYIQCREDDTDLLNILKKITDEKTLEIIKIEREFSKIFDGGCHTPMGCAGYFIGDEIELQGMYYSNGIMSKKTYRGKKEEKERIARILAEKIQEEINGK